MVGSDKKKKGAAMYYQVVILSTWSIHRMLRESSGARTNSTVMTEVTIFNNGYKAGAQIQRFMKIMKTKHWTLES